jgi:hypothetical protein
LDHHAGFSELRPSCNWSELSGGNLIRQLLLLKRYLLKLIARFLKRVAKLLLCPANTSAKCIWRRLDLLIISAPGVGAASVLGDVNVGYPAAVTIGIRILPRSEI